MLGDVPAAMPAGPSGPAQPGVITAVVAAITATGTAARAASKMDGRSTHGKGGQATHQVGPESVRPGAGFPARKDRGAHIADARLAVTRPASAYGLNPRYIARITRFSAAIVIRSRQAQMPWSGRHGWDAQFVGLWPLGQGGEMEQSCRGGERLQRLGVIKRASVGAEGSQQITVPGGGTVDESEVRLMMVTGPPVVRVG